MNTKTDNARIAREGNIARDDIMGGWCFVGRCARHISSKWVTLIPMWCLERGARLLRTAVASCAALLATLSMGTGLAAAEPPAPTLKVSGAASFSTETRVTGETFEVRAVLADEVGRPIA